MKKIVLCNGFRCRDKNEYYYKLARRAIAKKDNCSIELDTWNCFGNCGRCPNIAIETEKQNKLYSNVSEETLYRIIDKLHGD